MEYILYIVTGLALIVSLCFSRQKTLNGLKIAWKRFYSILPAFILMLILISIVLYLLPDTFIADYLGAGNKVTGILTAALLGSVIAMPGFIVFPLCGILLEQGVPYMVLSSFSTTLMMVGVLSYPVEKAYLGTRVTILRNLISFFVALMVAVMTGLFFGELLS